MKLVRLVPCCTITTQQDQIIRVLLGQFLKKYIHTSRITSLDKGTQPFVVCDG